MTTEATLFEDAEMIEAELMPTPLETPSSIDDTGSAAARTSFTADTPYYTSYVEKEMNQVSILSETLKDISSRAKTFGKCGELMAESTRRLSSACRLETTQAAPTGSDDEGDESARLEKEARRKQLRKEAVGDEMTSVLELLAEVLDEVASAQVQMCESLEASLAVFLESFADTEMQSVVQLKSDVESSSETAEAAFSRYFNGRYAEKVASGQVGESWNKLSESAANQISSTLQKWKSGDLLTPQTTTDRVGATLKNWRNESASNPIPPSPMKNRRSTSKDFDPILQAASTAANLQLTLEQIRLAQASAELKRFQLLKKLVSIKKRRNFELGESALASLHGIRAYFNNCSDLVQGLAPRLKRIQKSQSLSREKHFAQQAPWETRELGLLRALETVSRAVEGATRRVDIIAQNDNAEAIAQQPTSLEDIEERTRIWHLPAMLAESSRYQRDPNPNVLVEGWLYKKSSSRMTLQTWSRRWFMMDKDGIYYFHLTSPKGTNSNGGVNNGYLHTLERVKICDTVLCMVRELKDDGLRFRFEIVTPNQRPVQLQARGPQDYKMWVEGIRLGAQNQLVHGHVSSDALMQGLGKSKKKRGDAAEVTLASMVKTEPSRSSSSEEYAEVPTPHFRESNDDIGNDDARPMDGKESTMLPINPMVQEILDANPICADCGKAAPDWACINLGVLVCIECSGVHRSLGVHLSKVRSLRMDALSESECRLLLSLGNDRVNPIWEAALESQRGWKKPTGDDSRKVKEEWIKSKYQWKGFLDVDSSSDHNERMEQVNHDLYTAASSGNLLGVAGSLAHGGSVDWKNPRDEGKTALHAVAVSKSPHDDESCNDVWQGIECAELLLQNGAKMKTLDDNHQGALDCAVIGGAEREMIEFLSSKSS